MSEEPTPNGVPERLLQATIKLLAEQGPSAIKARTVASEAGMSTMVVYSHFGGIPELMQAVADRGYAELGSIFSRTPTSGDPVADLFEMALVCRELARDNPHLYDLMFGLSTRATYRPLSESSRLSGHSPAFQDAYRHLTEACARLVDSGRVEPRDPEAVAAQLWSFVHGYITLELAAHFAELDDPVTNVFMALGVNLCVGLGDDRKRAQKSHQAALSRHRAMARA